ncbi:MAG: HD domain-containing protein [Promethearchaeota archaeon]
MKRIINLYQGIKKKVLFKYQPSYEWFKLNNINIFKNSEPIDKSLHNFENFFKILPENDLFDEKSNKFGDVCYGTVEIEQKFIPILNHPLMIRLMYLKQLSMTYVYHFSATHNRFSHSIGTYKRVEDIIQKLTHTNYPIINDSIQKNRDLLLIYALIHDIGHQPFSHSLEYMFKSNDKDILEEILFKDDSLRNVIIKILNKNKIPFESFIKIVTTRSSSEQNLDEFETLLKKCIDSPLDADRMDWLNSDVKICSGDEIKGSIEAIIKHIVPFKDNTGKWIIAFQDKPECVNRIIDFLHRRHSMYTDVYELDKKVILEEIIARLIFQISKENRIDLERLKFLTEDVIINFIIDYSNQEQRKMLNSALFGHNYQKIESLTIEENLNKRFHSSYEKMLSDITIRIEFEKFLCKESGLENDKNLIIFHFPRKFISEADQIILVDDENNPTSLKDHPQYKGIKALDEKRAPYFQLFLSDKGDGNFEKNKEKVLSKFNELFLSTKDS